MRLHDAYHSPDCAASKRRYGARMFRLFAPLALLPGLAHADITPRPLMFTFDATLATCLADQNSDDLAGDCAQAITAAYALKRAVAWGVLNCTGQDLRDCAAPFENEGLPHIAVRIAADVGCETTDITQLATLTPLPQNHCITVASDIMIDEGVVPLVNEIACGLDRTECSELAQIHAAFWVDQVDILAPGDATINDLQMRNAAECQAVSVTTGGWASDLAALDCLAEKSAALWADLVQTTGQN